MPMTRFDKVFCRTCGFYHEPGPCPRWLAGSDIQPDPYIDALAAEHASEFDHVCPTCPGCDKAGHVCPVCTKWRGHW